MKLKKILAAIAACAMSAAMVSMTVSAAGIGSDDDEIVDEFDGGDELGDGDDEFEEPDDGDDAGETEDQGTAPVETAKNPVTGNAPIALAVIPVALAAAAVVAKKAK